MARQYELREIATGRVLGTVSCVDDVAPGALVLFFKQDLVQVDAAKIANAVEVEVEAEPRAKGKKRR